MNNNSPNRLLRRDELPRPPAERARERIMSNMRIRIICSAVIDLQVANMVCWLLMHLLLPLFGIENIMDWALKYKGYHPHPVLAVSYLVLMLLKDIVRSPGKRIMKLKLTGRESSAPVWKRILRNITAAVWPVEAIALLVSGRRLTDRVLGLNVVGAEEKKETPVQIEGEKQP